MNKKLLILLSLLAILMLATPVFAQAAPAAAEGGSNWYVCIAAGIGIGIAAGLAGIGQGKIGAAACEGIARNPSARAGVQTAMILSLAFVESLVLFALVIMFAKVVK
jgi:F-type H+-transporting ATPase subunit c